MAGPSPAPDPGGVLVTLATLVGVPGVVAAVVTGIWLARRSETRQARRDGQLRRLGETRQLYLSNFRWMVDQREKGWVGAVSGPVFEHTYGDVNLVGDQEVIQAMAHFVRRVLLVKGGPRMTPAENEEYLNLNRRVLDALDAQEQRAIEYKPLKKADWELADRRAAEWLEQHPDGKVRMAFVTARH